jgi:hypothetical protein
MQLGKVGALDERVLAEVQREAYRAQGHGIADHRFRYSPLLYCMTFTFLY